MKTAIALALWSVLLFAQTKIDSDQMKAFPLVTGIIPRAETRFAEEGQAIYILAPGSNEEIVKVEVYRNGLLQSDIDGVRVKADYSMSSNRTAIIFNPDSIPRLDDIIRILSWVTKKGG